MLTPSLRIGYGSPTSLAVSPDGRWMAVGTQFGVYQYWADTFEQAWFAPPPGETGRLAFDPQSQRLGASTEDGIVLLDAASGAEVQLLEGAGGSFAWAPDSQRLVSGGGCEQVIVWDVHRGAALKELRGDRCSEGYSGISVTWAADGRIYAASMGTEILAWDGDTYAPMEDFSAKGAHQTWISALIAAPAGSLLAQYDSMGRLIVTIIDGQQDRQIQVLERQNNGPVVHISWAPDGKRLAAGYGMGSDLTLIWNAESGKVEQEIEGFYSGMGLGWSPDGDTLFGLISPEGGISAVEVSTGRAVRSLTGHTPVGSFLTWTQDGLVSTWEGVKLTWWDPASGMPVRQETVGAQQARVYSWPPAGPGIYLFSGDYRQIGTSESRHIVVGVDDHENPSPTVWSWDGSRLASPTGVWDVTTGELLAQLRDPSQQHRPDMVAWAPDGSRLASADSLAMQPPVIWDAQTGEVLLTLNAETGGLKPIWFGLAWSPDGKQVAAVGGLMNPDSGEDKGMILIWDAATGQQEQLLTAGMDGLRLWAVAWSPDGRYLACGTTGKELFVWDVANGKPLARLEGHTDMVAALAWSPDGQRLASVARDGTLQVWDVWSNH